MGITLTRDGDVGFDGSYSKRCRAPPEHRLLHAYCKSTLAMQLPFHAHLARIRPHDRSAYTPHRQSCAQTLAPTPITITSCFSEIQYVQYNAIICNRPANSSVRKDLREHFHTNLVKPLPSAAFVWPNTVPGDATKLQPRVQPQTRQRESTGFADNPC